MQFSIKFFILGTLFLFSTKSFSQDYSLIDAIVDNYPQNILSLDDVVITNFATGPGTTTLPILIWSKVKLGVTPDINALATIIVAIVSVGVGIAGIVMNRAEKRRDRDMQLAYQANQ